MNRPELLSPAGSIDSIRAAVQSGADAVYFGFGTFNARRGAAGFSKEEMRQVLRYCRERGVKTNVTVNILISDRERERAMEDIFFLNEAGADALIVQDVGLARLIRTHVPDLPMHASTQMTVHTLEGALAAKELGFSRVVLSRELPLTEVERITQQAGVETEVFVHGALCMCYSGQCYMSAVIGQRSGNRGLCAQPCRLPYEFDVGNPLYPLSLKDLSLAHHLHELVEAGVASLKIEGRMKRPEYTAIVTKIYADLLREDRQPTPEEDKTLALVFSRDGFTDGYFTGEKKDMFGVRTEAPLSEVQHLYTQAAHRFEEGREAPRVPCSIQFYADTKEVFLTVSDGTHTVTARSGAPEQAVNRPTTAEMVQKALSKTGGTPFYLAGWEIDIKDNLMLPASVINAMRREALDELLSLRGQCPERRCIPYKSALQKTERTHFRGFIAEVRNFAQAEAIENVDAIYLPLAVLAEDKERTRALSGRGVTLAAVLPRVYLDREQGRIEQMLNTVKQNGVQAVLVGNIGQIALVKRLGMTVYGDFGLNVFNSDALSVYAGMGAVRLTLSFEQMLPQLRDLVKIIDTELIVYGYLPLMLFENCAVRRKSGSCACEGDPVKLTDRTGRQFALLPEFGCRNTLLNSQPLSLRQAEFDNLGVPYARMRFMVEPPATCREIVACLMRGDSVTAPEGVTRGLYRRGVE